MKRFMLETERLTIRELEMDDLDFVAAMLSDPETMRFWPRPFNRDEAEAWIERHQGRYLDHGYGYWVVVRKADGYPIGQAGLLHQEFGARIEVGLGYILHRPFWGQGYAFEAATACLDHGFRVLGLERIVALIRPENLASIRLAERLKLVRTGSTTFSDLAHDVYEISAHASR